MRRSGKPRVAVVGAGLGGLSAAIALAAEGFDVEVFEKNAHVGGKLNFMKTKGFYFDLGPSILILPQYFQRLWKKAGRRLEASVDLQPVAPHWRSFFEDNAVVDLWAEPGALRSEASRFGRKLPARLEKFLAYASRQFDLLAPGYFERGLDTAAEFGQTYSLKEFMAMDFWHTMHAAVRKRLGERHWCAIFDYFIKYVGSSPYRAPGFMNLMAAAQFRYGLWYVRGGMYQLARGMARLALQTGVRIRCHSEVVRLQTRGRIVSSLTTADGRVHPADYVVSNMEVVPTHVRLLRSEPSVLREFDRFEPSCSALVLHLGTDTIYPQLAHHNFFHTRNPRRYFRQVFRQRVLPDDPTVYVVAPSRSDPGVCPPGCDNLKILPHVPNLGRPYTGEDYSRLRERVMDKLERMGLRGLGGRIVAEHLWTPDDIEANYFSTRGSIYGVVSDRGKNFALKAPKASRHYDNLFFVGGSVNPGGGMPMVVMSGLNVVRCLQQARGKPANQGDGGP